MKHFVLFLVCIFVALNAIANCKKEHIEINFKYRTGPVIYNNKLSYKELDRMAPQKLPPGVRGLTLGKLNVTYEPEGRIYKYENHFCVGLRKINFYIGYDDFKVYIDKKYKKNSCQYKAVKAHEDEHVLIFKEGMKFFAPDIKRTIKKAVKNIHPRKVYSVERAEQIFHNQGQKVLDELQPLLEHINQKIDEKQSMIDTPQSYKEVQKKCRRW